MHNESVARESLRSHADSDLELSPASLGRPSIAMRALGLAVRSRIIRRGYSWLLACLPPRVWGGELLRVDTSVGPMVLPVRERSSSSLLCIGSNTNEWRETKLVAALAATCQTMFDIGAHHGWYCRVMARSSHSGRVFGFEPDERTFRYLTANVSDLPRVSVHKLALSDRQSAGVLWRGSTSDLNSIVRRIGNPEPVSFCSIDRFCSEHGIDEVDFVKCDVEGAEVLVLRGAETLLRGPKPPIWMVEVSEQFWSEGGFTPQDFTAALQPYRGKFCLFSQDERARPVEIQKLEERMLGNNVFLVPQVRMNQWKTAMGSF